MIVRDSEGGTERAVIASVMLLGYDVMAALPPITGRDFADPIAGAAWDALRTLADSRARGEINGSRESKYPSPGDVADEVRRAGRRAPTETDIIEWIDGAMATGIAVRRACESILAASTRRAAIGALSRALARLRDPESSDTAAIVSAAIADAQRAIASRSHDIVSAAAAASEGRELIERGGTAIETGFSELDRMTGGIPHGITVLAGRPAMGKSAVARAMAMSMAARGIRVGYITLEETRAQWAANCLTTLGRVDSGHVTRGCLTDAERHAVVAATRRLEGLPIHVADERPMTADGAARVITALATAHGCKVVFIDYWNRLALGQSRSSLREEANDVVTTLSAVAGRLRVPLIVVAQLNRDSPREQRLPRLEDLKETGAWEEAATMVVLVHREGAARHGEPDDIIDLIVAKSKTTRTGTITMRWTGKHYLIEEIEPFARGQRRRTEAGVGA